MKKYNEFINEEATKTGDVLVAFDRRTGQLEAVTIDMSSKWYRAHKSQYTIIEMNYKKLKGIQMGTDLWVVYDKDEAREGNDTHIHIYLDKEEKEAREFAKTEDLELGSVRLSN